MSKKMKLILSQAQEIQTSKYSIRKLRVIPKKLLTADFKRSVYMGEQKTPRDNRFLKRTQIARMIFDYVKISGTGEALFERSFESPVEEMTTCKGFDTGRDEVLLFHDKVPVEDKGNSCRRRKCSPVVHPPQP